MDCADIFFSCHQHSCLNVCANCPYFAVLSQHSRVFRLTANPNGLKELIISLKSRHPLSGQQMGWRQRGGGELEENEWQVKGEA